ncbi:MAG: hypothetical protein KKF56_00430 [Nanoarchaeota archaeon]|nr:hypothetical protein [Nanoarchaeota archaeon]
MKKGAIELSVGTIVIIVLGVTMLVLGMIFVKSIMCSGIVLTGEIDEKVSNEIRDLFGAKEYGVKCHGEGTDESKLGDGGRRKIACIINEDEDSTYRFRNIDITSLKGASTSDVRRWILDDDVGTLKVRPGKTTVAVIILDIPKKVTDSSLKIEMDVERTTGDSGTPSTETHTLYIDVTHVGGFAATIC